MFLPHKAFLKRKTRNLVLVSLPHFLHDFWRKKCILLCSITWQNFIVWLPLLCEILGNMCKHVLNTHAERTAKTSVHILLVILFQLTWWLLSILVHYTFYLHSSAVFFDKLEGWNESNMLTMDHKLVLESSSSAAVYTPRQLSIWISSWDRSTKRIWNLI